MLEINKKEDILIPFDSIGSDNWQVNTRLILDSLAYNWNSETKEPVSQADLLKLENRLDTTLPTSLHLFYRTFGVADIGEILQPLEEIDWLKNIWPIPEYGPDFNQEEQTYLPYLITFSDYLGNGNMFCFHSKTKAIYYYDHDCQPYLTKLFDKVDDYIKGCLILAQSDLFVDVDQEDVEAWTEGIVSNILSYDIVRKWRY